MRQHSSVRHYFSVSNPASRSTTDDCHFFSTHNWSTVPRAELAVPGLRFNFACSGGEGVRGDKHQRIQNFHRRLFWSLVGRTTNCGAWIEEMGQKEGWWPGEDFCPGWLEISQLLKRVKGSAQGAGPFIVSPQEKIYFFSKVFLSIFGFRGGRLVVSQRSVLDIGGFEIQIQIQRFEWVWRWGVVWLCAGSKAVEAALVAACSLISPQLWKLPFNRDPTALVHPARQDQETDTDSKMNNPTTINTNNWCTTRHHL